MARRKKSTVVATNGSVPTETSTLKEGDTPIPQECTPEKENTTCQDTNSVAECGNKEGDTPEEFQKRLQVSHDFIVKFAQMMSHGCSCQALIADYLYNDMLVEEEVYENDVKLPAEQIIADAQAITHAGRLLHDNFSKEHDNAVKVLSEIMSRHAPQLQKKWSKWAEKENSK